MEREIKNGVTILHTAADHIGCKNTLGCPGISHYKPSNGYRVEISIGKKKFLIGLFMDLQDAIKARRIAESKKADGNLVEWLNTIPHGNSEHRKTFWDNEFLLY